MAPHLIFFRQRETFFRFFLNVPRGPFNFFDILQQIGC